MWIVTILYWLQVFLCPVLISSLTDLFITGRIHLIIVIISAIVGIVAAEYVRRKIGLDKFFGGLYNHYDDKL